MKKKRRRGTAAKFCSYGYEFCEKKRERGCHTSVVCVAVCGNTCVGPALYLADYGKINDEPVSFENNPANF